MFHSFDILIPSVSVGKAFVAATILVFGGAVLAFELAASKLELRNVSAYFLAFIFEMKIRINMMLFGQVLSDNSILVLS